MHAHEGEVTEEDGVPYDISIDSDTIVMRYDTEHEMDPEVLSLSPGEKELLRVLVKQYAAYRRHQRTWSHARLLIERGTLQGLHIALDVMATSVDAKIQAYLWSDKLATLT